MNQGTRRGEPGLNTFRTPFCGPVWLRAHRKWETFGKIKTSPSCGRHISSQPRSVDWYKGPSGKKSGGVCGATGGRPSHLSNRVGKAEGGRDWRVFLLWGRAIDHLEPVTKESVKIYWRTKRRIPLKAHHNSTWGRPSSGLLLDQPRGLDFNNLLCTSLYAQKRKDKSASSCNVATLASLLFLFYSHFIPVISDYICAKARCSQKWQNIIYYAWPGVERAKVYVYVLKGAKKRHKTITKLLLQTCWLSIYCDAMSL